MCASRLNFWLLQANYRPCFCPSGAADSDSKRRNSPQVHSEMYVWERADLRNRREGKGFRAEAQRSAEAAEMLHRAEGPSIKLGLRKSGSENQKQLRRKHAQRSLRIFFLCASARNQSSTNPANVGFRGATLLALARNLSERMRPVLCPGHHRVALPDIVRTAAESRPQPLLGPAVVGAGG
jgi:hypothetical protein